MIAYVDDSNGQTNSFHYNDQTRVVDLTLTKVRQNTQAWANLLGVSGGAVELSKCSCHVMEWIYSRQGAPVLSPLHRKDVQIQVSDPTINCSSTLQVLSRFRAHKTLEHFQEPTGVQTEQYRRLLQEKWVQCFPVEVSPDAERGMDILLHFLLPTKYRIPTSSFLAHALSIGNGSELSDVHHRPTMRIYSKYQKINSLWSFVPRWR